VEASAGPGLSAFLGVDAGVLGAGEEGSLPTLRAELVLRERDRPANRPCSTGRSESPSNSPRALLLLRLLSRSLSRE